MIRHGHEPGCACNDCGRRRRKRQGVLLLWELMFRAQHGTLSPEREVAIFDELWSVPRPEFRV